MATLRNKTTEEGYIIRWLPHPEHTRPSTYQVASSAVRLLAEIGYSAPSPGDECEIPRDVCRPLRILGDLYFKSECQGEVELLDVSRVTGRSVDSLSAEQQELLWSYVESHSHYTGRARELLPDDSGSPPPEGQTSKSANPQKDGSDTSASDFSGPDIIPSRNVHVGRISRFSNAGNAMFRPREGRELNLGSLPRSTLGKTTIGAQYASGYALCLTPQLWTGSYRKKVRDDLEDLIERTGLDGMERLLGIRDIDSSEDLSRSDISVYLALTGDGFGIGFRGPWTIVVLGDHLGGHRQIRVEVVDDHDEVLVARPLLLGKDSEPVGVGSEIEISVDRVEGGAIWGTCGPRLVRVKRTSSQPGRLLRAAITEIDSDHIIASVSALDDFSCPTPGELVTFADGALAEYPGIPVMTPASLPEVDAPLSLVVDNVETDGVRASVEKISEFSSLSVGQRLSVRVDSWDQGVGTAVVDGVPLRIEGGRPLPRVAICTEITEFTEGYARGRFIRADVPEEGSEDVETLLRSGDQLLQEEEYETALTTFVRVAEISRQTGSPEYSRARLREILGICELYHSRNNIESGIALLEAIDFDAEGLDERIVHQLAFYHRILEADLLITDAESADGVTATTYRRDAKRGLEKAVNNLTTPEDATTAPLHPAIIGRLSCTADRLLLVPDPVSEYLNSASVS